MTKTSVASWLCPHHHEATAHCGFEQGDAQALAQPGYQLAVTQLSSCKPGTLANSRVLWVTSRAC